MAHRKPLLPSGWVRYRVGDLLREQISTWRAYCRVREQLQEGPLGDSPSRMHQKNHERPRLETCSRLVELALRETGPVRLDGRLFKSADSTYSTPEPAEEGVQDADTLHIEIYSPINGMARKCL